MIARLEVTRGSLTEYPLAEKTRGGWQNGVTFYPDAEVTKVTPLIVSRACICTPAIAGISDGPNLDCPEHGEPQGEPSDAQVLAALNAYAPWATEYHLSDWGEGSAEPMRAALRAAAGVVGQEGEPR